MTGSIRASTITAVALTAFWGSAAHAAKPANMDPVGRAAVIQAVSDCRKITEDAARLACYDKAAGALDQAETQGQVVVIDREQAKAVRRQAFGFSMPSLSIFSRGTTKTDEGVDHLTLDIESAHRTSDGRWVFVAANGAVWRQTEDAEIFNDPHKGSVLLVKSGLLGGFFCKIDGQPQVRCERVK